MSYMKGFEDVFFWPVWTKIVHTYIAQLSYRHKLNTSAHAGGPLEMRIPCVVRGPT